MRALRRLLASSILLVLALAGVAAASADAQPPSPVVGHVYVNDNTAGANCASAWTARWCLSTPSLPAACSR